MPLFEVAIVVDTDVTVSNTKTKREEREMKISPRYERFGLCMTLLANKRCFLFPITVIAIRVPVRYE